MEARHPSVEGRVPCPSKGPQGCGWAHWVPLAHGSMPGQLGSRQGACGVVAGKTAQGSRKGRVAAGHPWGHMAVPWHSWDPNGPMGTRGWWYCMCPLLWQGTIEYVQCTDGPDTMA